MKYLLEFGYLSVDGCGWRNWELERGIEERNINQQAQANCLEALFSTFQPEPWWAGRFLWKWFPNMRGHEGYPERDYTPGEGTKGWPKARRRHKGTTSTQRHKGAKALRLACGQPN